MTIFGKNVIVKSADFGHFEGWRFLAQNFATLANFDQQELGTLEAGPKSVGEAEKLRF